MMYKYQVAENSYLIISIVIFCTFLSPTYEIGFRSSSDTTNMFSEIEGDAPNSSICRRMVSNFTEPEIRCLIAKQFPGCQFDSGFLQYLVFQYCNFNERIVPTIFMIFWLILLLGAFATISDSFFSTSLIALARTLRMNQNLAGVTLLAFGNGAPDVFSAVTAITTGDPDAPDEGLGLGFLLGSGLMVNTVTAGLVIFFKPFKMSRRPFLKDTIFYMIAVSWAASILIRRQIHFTDAIGFLIFYLIYVFTTWASSTYMKRQRSHGTKSILPLSLQRILSKPLSRLSRYGRNLVQVCKPYCPQCLFLARIRKKLNFSQFKKSPTANNHTTTEDGLKKPGKVITDQISPRKTIQLPTIKLNGTVPLTDQVKVIIPNIHVSDKRMNKRHVNTPKIEITSPKNDRNDDSDGGLDGEDPGSPYFSHGLSDFGVGCLNPADGVKKRASSMTSTEPVTHGRRLSTEHPGSGRGRCRRTQSVVRRRPSTRMSAAGYELSYMVRWIIANRELEEKVLGSRDGETKSQKFSQYDAEESQNESSINRDLFSRKGSRLASTLATPTHMPSPASSDYSAEDDTMQKSSSSLKKIKLHFLPTDSDTGKQMPGTGDNDEDSLNKLPKFNNQEGTFEEYEDVEDQIQKQKTKWRSQMSHGLKNGL
ncbi:unnamed protein product [Heterobilharzia americana]|nr:unnamed protein product [Heterobilharzia americana]